MDCKFKRNDAKKSAPSKASKAKKPSEEPKMPTSQSLPTPSEYIHLMRCHPEQLLLRNSSSSASSLAFTATPRILVFKRFSLGRVYNACLQIRNTSRLPHQIRQVSSSDSVSFRVKCASMLNARLAPGMSLNYDVEFRPDDDSRDYLYDVGFATDLGEFSVPVLGVGPKPLLAFDDRIDVGEAAVKVAKSKPILLSNVGDAATPFSFFSDNDEIEILPSKGSAEPNESLEITITLTSRKVGFFNGSVFLRYGSGDTVKSVIHGESVSCDVKVSIGDFVEFERTYLRLSRMTSFEIGNDSDYSLSYEWLKHADAVDEARERDELLRGCSAELIGNESLVFGDEHFDVSPMRGEIAPRSSARVSVTFQPKTVGDLDGAVAYLEVGGREDRIPVKLSGKCLGPSLELNVVSLDIQEVYLCSEYSYELVCKNSGAIPGTLRFVERAGYDFGCAIRVDPRVARIDVGELESFKLTFSSDRTGKFVERVDFEIEESSGSSTDSLSFVLKGAVVWPIARIDEGEIAFRPASIGFPMKKCLVLRNLSHAPIDFQVRIQNDDGHERPVTYDDFATAQQVKPKLPESPKEFSASPSSGVADPNSDFSVQLNFTPNVVRTSTTTVQIHLSKSKNAVPLMLPIEFDAKLATFVVEPSIVNLRFCFVNHTYCKKLRIRNDSDVHGYFYVLPQRVSASSAVLYSLSTCQGYLKPGEAREVILTVIIQRTGPHDVDLQLLGLGNEEPVPCCRISCDGQGPVISIEPDSLDFGEVKVLQRKTMTLKLTNDSPICAGFNLALSKTNSVWQFDPACGELRDDESAEIEVSVFPRDPGKYTDELLISIPNGKTIVVNLAAVGAGSSVVFQPDVYPTFDLGCVFSHRTTSVPITVKNEGNRHHRVLLTNSEKLKPIKKGSSTDEIESSKFKVEPSILELAPGSTETINCSVRWDSNEIVTEQWYVYATMDSQGKRELLGTSTFKATFVEPKVTFDKRELSFRLDYGRDRESLQQYDQLQMANGSGRDLTARCRIDQPFLMMEECNCYTNELAFKLVNEESRIVRLYFPYDARKVERTPRKFEGHLRIQYDEHSCVDKVRCTAEVNFPHLALTPREINLYCVVGARIEETVRLINDGPLTVSYAIKWTEDSFSCRKIPSDGAAESECSDASCSSKSSSFSRADEYEEEQSYSLDPIDRFLRVLPSDGEMPANSERLVSFVFNGSDKVKLSARAVCEVAGGGPAEIVKVNAVADYVRCDVQDEPLDYGLQLYCEAATTRLRMSNCCAIPLYWSIETSSSLIRVVHESNVDYLEPHEDSFVTLERLPSAPGAYDERIYLEIAHLEPRVIGARWYATVPQVYLMDVARRESFERHPVEMGYRAVQLVMQESTIQEGNLAQAKCSEALDGIVEFSDYEMAQLVDDDWQVIAKDEKYPSSVDIDMALERLIFKDHVLRKSSRDIPAPSYTIDLSYVVVDRTKLLTVSLNNYGYEKAKVKLRKEDAKRKSAKSCFNVQLERSVEICQCESTTLSITFSPRRAIFKDTRTDCSFEFWLEVKHGFTIPVCVKATAVYPCVTAGIRQILNFDKVYLGECREMSLLMKNTGWVDCRWQIGMEDPSAKRKNPFNVPYTADIFEPGQEAAVKVYFKPCKNGVQKRSLTITVQEGQDAQTIQLVGCGVERRLAIDRPDVRFSPIVPNTASEEEVVVRNDNNCAVELCWRHLYDFSERNRVVRVLRHYCGVDEMLIPRRKVGENFPAVLSEFYDDLVYRMTLDDDFRSLAGNAGDGATPATVLESLKDADSNQVESLVHAYIDKLQSDANFSKTMKDPLSELYDDEDRKLHPENPSKKLVMIFHGAPYTEYQETACRVARALDLPLLNLNNLYLEAISSDSSRVADHLDSRYKELTQKLEKFASLHNSNKSSDKFYRVYQILRRIPPAEELDCMDAYSLYEHKLDTINAILDLTEHQVEVFGSPRVKSKTSLKSDGTARRQSFLMGMDVWKAILCEMLAGSRFRKGYVLQSLSNEFVRSETGALRMLLEATGEVECCLFVTFHNSLDVYEARKRDERSELLMERFRGMDEAEVELLSEEERSLYDRMMMVKEGRTSETQEDDVEASKRKKKKKSSKTDDDVPEIDFSTRGMSDLMVLKSMDDYQSSLSRLLDVVIEWEKSSSQNSTKVSKSKDKAATSTLLQPTEKFRICHVRSSDPWDRTMYDLVSSTLPGHFKHLTSDEKMSEVEAQCRTYTILREREILPTALLPLEVFALSECEEPLASQESSSDARWVLHPGESKKFNIRFMPSEEGRFKSEFHISSIDNADANFRIKVEGLAEIPRLDLTPECVFDRVKTTKTIESHEPAYFSDTYVYDFGSLLVLPAGKVHKKVSRFKLTNSSIVNADVSLSLASEDHSFFDVTPRDFVIEPSETRVIDVTACTETLGILSDDLMINVKNNDRAERIQIAGNGIGLNVEIVPEKIDFGRVLANRSERQSLTMRNQSAIMLYWRLSSSEDVDSQISVTPSSGKIKYRGICEICLEYYADKISTDEKSLTLDVFLKENDREPISSEKITISAEVYEADVVCIAEHPIDFECIPVNLTASKSIALKNLGPYEVRYEIQTQEFESLRKRIDYNTYDTYQQSFTIHPSSGSIPPKKQASINLTFAPTVEVTLKSVPLLRCFIVEPYKNSGVIDEFTLDLSAISYCTRFSIEPWPSLNFGTLALRSTKSMMLQIRNTGSHALTYSIAKDESPDTMETSRRDKKQQRSSKRLSRNSIKQSSHIASIQVGPFKLERSTGELEPNEADSIGVACSSDSIGYFDEDLAISVPHNEGPRKLSLVANVAVAEIDFASHKDTFPESHVVERYESTGFERFTEHTVFSRETNRLHFCRVCVGGSHAARVTLRNVSAVSGDVVVQVDDSDAFGVDCERLSVPAMSKASFAVTFRPTLLTSYTSRVTLRLDLPSDVDPQTCVIDLEGESCVPRVKLIEPARPLMDFGLTFASEMRQETLKIRNVGKVVARARFELREDYYRVFGIEVDDERGERFECGCEVDDDVGTRFNTLINPDEEATARVRFQPKKPDRFSASLRISVDDNPYETLEVNLSGEGFTRSVIIENLPMLNSSSNTSQARRSSCRERSSSKHTVPSRSSSKTLVVPRVPSSYILDYLRCFLNKMIKRSFKITNKTKSRHFRFEWDTHPNVIVTPIVGHLAPGRAKELTATFLSTESVALDNTPLGCAIDEIIPAEPDSEPWDARQTEIVWLEKCPSEFQEEACNDEEDEAMFLKKVVRETKEPEFDAVPDTSEPLQLLISAVADYSDYECDLGTIDFQDTLMFQTRKHKFALKNPGIVELDYTWDLTMDERYPLRLDQANYSTATTSSSCCETSNQVSSYSSNDTQFSRSRRCQGTSDLFSSSAGLTDRSTDSWIEGENWPFEISPQHGVLAPGEQVECVFKFSPIDVFEYKAYLRCRMENVNPSKPLPCITVTAKSLLPYCHFEVEESDYLTSGRRDVRLPGPIGYSLADPEVIENLRVVEFDVLGVGSCHTCNVYLVNPTTDYYDYRWSAIPSSNDATLSLHCLCETGVAERGKRLPIPFTIVPEEIGTYESFWQFEIDKYDLRTLFLVVANVREPRVTCSSSNVLMKLGLVTLGETKTTSFEIKNEEEARSLSFKVLEDSVYSQGRFQAVTIDPMAGALGPCSSLTFNVEYKPTMVGSFSFDLKCLIEKLRKPIEVRVSAEAVEMLARVVYFDGEGREVVAREDRGNVVDVGRLMPCELARVEFNVANLSRLALDYSWHVEPLDDNDNFNVSVPELEGTIAPGTQEICYVDVTALKRAALRSHPVTLKMKNGPTYQMKLNASSKTPPLEFSFDRHDFGPCYVQDESVPSVNLTVTNRYKKPRTLKCDFANQSHLKLDLSELSQAIPPNGSVKVPIHFRPVDESIYAESIRFSVIGSSVGREVSIKGEGVPYKLRLKNACDSLIDLGTIHRGKTSSRAIRVVNEGRLPVSFRVVVVAVSSDDYLKVTPSQFYDLKPSREAKLTIRFDAVRRVAGFRSKVGLKVNRCVTLPLAVITASCAEARFHLSRSYVAFGAVYEGCELEERLILVNDGDVGSRFSWNFSEMVGSADVALTPASGYSAPGSEIAFSCAFKPELRQSSQSTRVAVLELENHESLQLRVSGNCLQLPEAGETLIFVAQPGGMQTREVEIGASDGDWRLRIVGESFMVERGTTGLCSISYRPTRESDADEGKLIVYGSQEPMVYDLRGKCTTAVDHRKIVRRVPAKRRLVEALTLYNDSDRAKSFDCKIELVGDERHSSTYHQIDVEAKCRKSDNIRFYFDQEGAYLFKVTFDEIDGDSDRRRSYDIEFEVTKPEILDTIRLTTFVRSPMFHSLRLENPLGDKSVLFEIGNTGSSDDVTLVGLPATVAPLSFRNVQLRYLPLLPCDNVLTTLEIVSEELGSAFYELNLTAKPAPIEKAIRVESSLGGSASFDVGVTNYHGDAAEFDVAVDDASRFACDGDKVTIPAQEEARVRVTFEPCSLETVRTTLNVRSSVAGEFVFPIIGESTPPTPRGPYVVTPDKPATMSFRNVHSQTKSFKFTVDNPIFKLENTRVSDLASKESCEIAVSLDEMPRCRSTKTALTGKLVVRCTEKALRDVKWIYYLKAVLL